MNIHFSLDVIILYITSIHFKTYNKTVIDVFLSDKYCVNLN